MKIKKIPERFRNGIKSVLKHIKSFLFSIAIILLLNDKKGINNNNNNIYLLQLGCHPVAVVI
jgi:hypothetical protein